MRWPQAAAVAVALHIVLLMPVLAGQEHQHHHEPAPPDMGGTARADTTDQMGHMQMLERPLGIPMTRMGSGTSWLPDASPMRAYHFMPDQWMLMVHGDVDLY